MIYSYLFMSATLYRLVAEHYCGFISLDCFTYAKVMSEKSFTPFIHPWMPLFLLCFLMLLTFSANRLNLYVDLSWNGELNSEYIWDTNNRLNYCSPAKNSWYFVFRYEFDSTKMNRVKQKIALKRLVIIPNKLNIDCW